MKRYGVIEYVINYKSSDYAPTFFKSKLVKSEEYLKQITISCLMRVNSSLVENIERIKSMLVNTTIEHNGLEYDVMLESVSELNVSNNSVVQVDFVCKGNIFKARQSKVITSSSNIDIGSIKETPINITIRNASGNVSINDMIFKDLTSSQVVVVNSEKGTVTGIDYEKWDFANFPKASDIFNVRIIGNASVTVDWRCKI